EAMQLRAQELSAAQFGQRALELKVEIKSLVYAPAQHPGIQRIQNIFRQQKARLYHWAKNPAIPADNNRAERVTQSFGLHVLCQDANNAKEAPQRVRTPRLCMARRAGPLGIITAPVPGRFGCGVS